MLPEKWYIRWRTEEAFLLSKEYFGSLPGWEHYRRYNNTGDDKVFRSDKEYGNYFGAESIGFKEISLEDFKQYVLKQTDLYEIY